MTALAHNLRYALRQLRRKPAFTAAAVLTLALGIGASTAIFSAVYPILFAPLPYPHPDRIMSIWEARGDGSPLPPTFGTFHGFAQNSRSFSALAALKPWQPAMIGTGAPERFDGQRVTSAYFRVLGIAPALGRDFSPADDQFHGPNVVLLSYDLWRRRFAADPAIVGKPVTLDGNLFTVLGVMPANLENVLAPAAQLWAPLQYDPSLPSDGREWGHHLRIIGRLRPGISSGQARGELNVILPTLAALYAKGYDSSGGAPSSVLLNPLQNDLTRDVKPALLAVLAAVLMLLLIACVNVTNLLLLRGAQRRGEFAMRSALGAAPSLLIRQLLTESLLLAALGGALGLAFAQAGIHILIALSPPRLPRLNAIHADPAVFAFALAVTTLVGLAIGLLPALHASSSDLRTALQQSSRHTSAAQHLLRRALVVSEVALALVLLISAGLLLRSLDRLFAIDPGFDPSHLLTMQVQDSGNHSHTAAAHLRFLEHAQDAVRHLPGVLDAAFTTQLPLSGDFESYGVEFASFPQQKANSEAAFRYSVTPGYFAAMRIPLRRGRLLDDRDRAGAPGAVLISQSFAQRKFPGKDPIGERVRLGPAAGHNDRPWSTIVGVVGDVKQASLAVNEPDAFYTPTAQWDWLDPIQSLVVRTRGDAASFAPAVRGAIWSVDKDQPIVRVATMHSLVAASEAQRRFALVLFAAFALVALVLAAIGIYGIVSGSVTERLREIGVRLALGASQRNILVLILRQGMALTVTGLFIGILAAALASRALVSLLFAVSSLDPVTYLAVVALLLAISLLACYLPARRAAALDPVQTLRAE